MYPPTSTHDQFLSKPKYFFQLKIHLHNLYKQLPHHYLILLPIHYLISNPLHLSPYQNFPIHLSNYNHLSQLFLITHSLITHYSSLIFHYPIL
ncbi:CDP-glycerol glycerophosphotransferase family protein, partial [Staphylococcus epidermidis]|uniref:CDP-glycerol glycerophosphotransferase family protein n=1 Tax=Staphylococcus epidermidis TaxID=1282 RepID=UPI0021B25264